MDEKDLQKEINEIDKKLNDLEQEELLDNNSKNSEWEEQYNEFEQTGENISLIVEKDKKIIEWFNMLSDNNELNWQQKSRTFSSSLFNILEKLLKIQKPHPTWEEQYKIVNTIGNYINNNDRIALKNKVLELIQLSKPSDNNQENISIKEENVYNNKNIANNEITTDASDLNDLDFYLIINKGAILPMEHPNYFNDRTSIKILEIKNSFINFDNNKYEVNTNMINKIKNYITENLERLVKYSVMEDNKYLINNGYYGGDAKDIRIKLGNLTISLNGQVSGEISDFCDTFINKIKEIIISGTLTNDDRDNLILMAVEKLKLIPVGSEFRINQIIDNFEDINAFNDKFDVFNKVIEESKKQGINFEPTNTGFTGMPWANIFIKK